MRNLPDTVNILGHVYKVIPCDTVINDENTTVLWGQIANNRQEIKVTIKEPCPDPMSILIHEIIHGCCDEGGIELAESDVKRLASILTDTLIRNGIIPKE